jgi:hypothetical protein
LATRLRDELHDIPDEAVDTGRLLAAAGRRARRRAVRTRTAVVIAVLVVGGAVGLWSSARPSTVVTDRPPTTPSPAAGGSDEGPDPAGPSGGAFDPIEGMDEPDGREPIASSEVGVVFEAQRRLVVACMGRHGFPQAAAMVAGGGGGLPPYLSPAELRTAGNDYDYDWAGAATDFLEAAPNPTAGMSPDEADAYGVALFGPDGAASVTLDDPGGGTVSRSAEGCQAEASEQLFGSVANAMRFDRAVEELLLGRLSAELAEQPSYREVRRAWQDCMAAAGYDVAAGSDETDYGATWLYAEGAAALGEAGAAQDTVTAEVIAAVASADADCQESSDLHRVRQAMLPHAYDDLAAGLGFDMPHYVAYQHAVLERARQVP